MGNSSLANAYASNELHDYLDEFVGLVHPLTNFSLTLQTKNQDMLHFDSDYMRGCCPEILDRLVATNMEQTVGYGADEYTMRARRLILDACGLERGDVYLLVGGTQTNSTVIDGALHKTQGVICAEQGHINVHEAGAIESCGHKVIALPSADGKITGAQVRDYLRSFYADETYEHMVLPGMVYISQPTEFGLLYSLEELTQLSQACHEYGILLYIDGARLGYALGCQDNDVTLKDLARLADVFYIGGTKVGTLFGEAVVVPNPEILPHFFTLIKQHGALLAKGRLLGIQFETLFEDGLYERLGRNGVDMARQLCEMFASHGFAPYSPSPTNQQFFELPNELTDYLMPHASFEYWGPRGETQSLVRFVTDWGTPQSDIDDLSQLINSYQSTH